MAMWGVYFIHENDDCGPQENLIEVFATKELADRYLADFPMLAYKASSDDDGWLVRFWSNSRDEVIAEYGDDAEGNVGRVPTYVVDNPYWGKTPAERREKWRSARTRDAAGRIEDANRTVSRVKAAATRACNTDPEVWIARHFPKGAEFEVRPISVRDNPVTYEDIRYSDEAEMYLRGHNES